MMTMTTASLMTTASSSSSYTPSLSSLTTSSLTSSSSPESSSTLIMLLQERSQLTANDPSSSSSGSSPSNLASTFLELTASTASASYSSSFGDFVTTDFEEETDHKLQQLTTFSIILAVILILIILITIIGNVFVILAIWTEKTLQTLGNYLVFSLAIADLMVAALVMPIGAVNEVFGRWIFGPTLCDFWTCVDVMSCSASILHLVAIALDRHRAVTNVDYIHTRTSRTIGVLIGCVWMIAVVISVAPVLGWKDDNYLKRITEENKCLLSQDVAYQIIATCSTFYIPLIVLLILYWKIFKVARKTIRHKPGQRLTGTPAGKGTTQLPPAGISKTANVLVANNTPKSPPTMNNGGTTTTTTSATAQVVQVQVTGDQSNQQNQEHGQPEVSHGEESQSSSSSGPKNNNSNTVDNKGPTPNNPTSNQSSVTKTTAVTFAPQQESSSSHKSQQPTEVIMMSELKSSSTTSGIKVNQVISHRESVESKRERKAAKTLVIITGAFIICWLPFFIFALVMPICGEECDVPEIVWSSVQWLGYLNSTINPIIYTIFSIDFRTAFKKILCGNRCVKWISERMVAGNDSGASGASPPPGQRGPRGTGRLGSS